MTLRIDDRDLVVVVDTHVRSRAGWIENDTARPASEGDAANESSGLEVEACDRGSLGARDVRKVPVPHGDAVWGARKGHPIWPVRGCLVNDRGRERRRRLRTACGRICVRQAGRCCTPDEPANDLAAARDAKILPTLSGDSTDQPV